jgi:hypothetical protein
MMRKFCLTLVSQPNRRRQKHDQAGRRRAGREITSRRVIQTDFRERRSLGKDSANRVLTMLKAILNHAWNDESNAIPTDQAWRKVGNNGIRARSLSHGFRTSNDPAAALR